MAKFVIELASGSSVEKIFKKTNAEMKAFLVDYVDGSGHDIPASTLTNAQLGTAVLLYLTDHMRGVVAPVRKARLEATQQATWDAQQAANQTQVESEIDI